MSSIKLPNEPSLTNRERQQRLTQLYLEPVAKELAELFFMVRQMVDPRLESLQPLKLGKPYPLGQCLEISQAFAKALAQLGKGELDSKRLQRALVALQKFTKLGGELRQVWGDLRGEYFQNAFILGSWYVDVANDTVNPSKPAIEILPFAESGLRPIQNFAHFAVIAKRYWKAMCVPNLIYPELAPFFPLIVLQPNAAPQLHGMFDYMIALTMRDAFSPSIEALELLQFPLQLFESLHSISKVEKRSPYDIEGARKMAVQECLKAKQNGHHLNRKIRDDYVRKALEVNSNWRRYNVSMLDV